MHFKVRTNKVTDYNLLKNNTKLKKYVFVYHHPKTNSTIQTKSYQLSNSNVQCVQKSLKLHPFNITAGRNMAS